MQKIKQFIICFFLFNNYFLLTLDKDPLLALIIMVKNEEPVMEATLKPFLQAGLQHYVILDTGSTDKTIPTVQNLFKKYKVQHGHIIEQPFVNFAVSRNYALERAEEIFPQAVFFLMIDAEWYMHNIPGLINFCQKHQNDESKAFLFKRYFPSDQTKDHTCWLFKAHQGVKFYGAVHETINYSAHIKVPDNVYVTIDPSRTGKAKTKKRLHKDLEVLLKEHQENPQNLRTVFYLGQTYSCLENYEQAIFWYKKICLDQKNNEEKYLAHYRIASIYQIIENTSEALNFFFKTYNLRPYRIEPLIDIAQYYLDIHDYYTAFLLANYTATIPMPHQELSLTFPNLYDSTRYKILATTAWYTGEYEIGKYALLKALQHDPNDLSLRNHLILCEEVLQHKHCNKLDRRFWCKWCNGTFWLTRPSWFNLCFLSHDFYPSNRCNLNHGIAWRSWVGPSFIELSNNV